MTGFRWSVVVFFFWLACASGFAEDPDGSWKYFRKPVKITADKMQVWKDEGRVVFSGRTRAVYDHHILKAAEMILYYLPKHGKNGKTVDVERMEAKGGVSLNSDGRIVTGEEAVFFYKSDQIIVKGNASLTDHNNVIRGDRLTVFLDRNKGVVQGDAPQRRVKALIFPHEFLKQEQTKGAP